MVVVGGVVLSCRKLRSLPSWQSKACFSCPHTSLQIFLHIFYSLFLFTNFFENESLLKNLNEQRLTFIFSVNVTS